MALMLQSGLGIGAVASSAATALLSAPTPTSSLATTSYRPPFRACGWFLLDEEGIVAGWFAYRGSANQPTNWLEQPQKGFDGRRQRVESRILHASICRGALEVRIVANDGPGLDLIILPSDFRLVEQVVAADGQKRSDPPQHRVREPRAGNANLPVG
jgi:hypothetical protein